MCIVIVKPAGKRIDTTLEAHLYNSFQGNSDGFGLMWNDGVSVHIRKGFMTWKSARKIINRVKDFAGNVDMVFHARWATHGSISSGNTHPFPITDDIAQLKAVALKTDMGIAHNGVITEYGSMKDDNDLSDTQQFIRHCLSVIKENITNPAILDLIRSATTSKFALMTPTDVHLIGTFVQEKNGCYYSNRDYEYAYKTTYVNRNTWGKRGILTGDDWEFDYGYGGRTGKEYEKYSWVYCDECTAGMYQEEAIYFNGKQFCRQCKLLIVECQECGVQQLLSDMSHLMDGVCDNCFIEHFGDAGQALTQEEIQEYYDSKYGVDDSDKPWDEPIKSLPRADDKSEEEIDILIAEARTNREKRIKQEEEYAQKEITSSTRNSSAYMERM